MPGRAWHRAKLAMACSRIPRSGRAAGQRLANQRQRVSPAGRFTGAVAAAGRSASRRDGRVERQAAQAQAPTRATPGRAATGDEAGGSKRSGAARLAIGAARRYSAGSTASSQRITDLRKLPTITVSATDSARLATTALVATEALCGAARAPARAWPAGGAAPAAPASSGRLHQRRQRQTPPTGRRPMRPSPPGAGRQSAAASTGRRPAVGPGPTRLASHWLLGPAAWPSSGAPAPAPARHSERRPPAAEQGGADAEQP